MGSGSLAAMAYLEENYKDDLMEEECKELVRKAIAAGIFNDLGSGSNVDLCILRTDGSKTMLRILTISGEKYLLPQNLCRYL